jgi:hypothetical protein
MKRLYPIGIQTFSEIIDHHYLYVDKTERIHELITTGKYYFLSRPRRFGKSLLLNTIEAIFLGNKDLFKNLWIQDQWDWSQRHPVIHISFSDIGVNTLGLIEAIYNALDINAKKLGLTLTAKSYDQQFRELIEKASVNGKVVILIDEYDKPLIDYLEDPQKAAQHRDIMKNFYSILKGADAYIRFLMITGVSRFSKVSIFSDLNNLNDITLSTRFGAIAGITQEELERDFAEEIGQLQQGNPSILQEIKAWYDGYSWDVKTRVYNPFSLLSFMAEPVFRNYWFATGSPSFLIKQIKGKGEFDFDNIYLGEISLGNFDITDTLSAPLLFQTGYLTLKNYNPELQMYELGYPNKEVKASLLDALLSAYREVFPGDSIAVTGNLKTALLTGDISKIIEGLNAVISTIPYDHWRADTESIFHIIMHLTFKKIGVDVESEVHSSKGRCDVLVKTARFIYVMELKLNGSARDALEQILSQQYLQPYLPDERKKIALGINFSSEERAVAEYEVGGLN